MSVVVQKFGGSSLSSIQQIKSVAQIIKRESENSRVVVIVSAMGATTNYLISHCREASNMLHNLSEYDSVLNSGENVSAGIMALCLEEAGMQAQSFQGWQVPILTNQNFSNALITKISVKKIKNCLNYGIIPVVTGFQGVTKHGRVTTLGRGGSDTTAVAIASALRASRCDIYTDVDGVFTADPRIVPGARLIPRLNYEEMLEYAVSGAKVLHHRAVEIAMRYKMPIRVMSTFSQTTGSIISGTMETAHIAGITYNKDVALIEILNLSLENKNDILLSVFSSGLNVNLIIDKNDGFKALILLHEINKFKPILAKYQHIILTDISIVTIIGVGVRNDPLITIKVFEVLQDMKLFPLYIDTSATKLSFAIREEYADKIIKTLHQKFNLA